MRHICAAISDNSFISWNVSNRIGSSHALLALCREPRTWLQMAEACVERSILQMMLDPFYEVHRDSWFCFVATHVTCPDSNERPPYGHFNSSTWPEPDAAHDQIRPRKRLPNVLQLHDRVIRNFARP